MLTVWSAGCRNEYWTSWWLSSSKLCVLFLQTYKCFALYCQLPGVKDACLQKIALYQLQFQSQHLRGLSWREKLHNDCAKVEGAVQQDQLQTCIVSLNAWRIDCYVKLQFFSFRPQKCAVDFLSEQTSSSKVLKASSYAYMVQKNYCGLNTWEIVIFLHTTSKVTHFHLYGVHCV